MKEEYKSEISVISNDILKNVLTIGKIENQNTVYGIYCLPMFTDEFKKRFFEYTKNFNSHESSKIAFDSSNFEIIFFDDKIEDVTIKFIQNLNKDFIISRIRKHFDEGKIVNSIITNERMQVINLKIDFNDLEYSTLELRYRGSEKFETIEMSILEVYNKIETEIEISIDFKNFYIACHNKKKINNL